MSVRASTRSYTRFTLAMGSSPGFGSTAYYSNRPFGLGFPAAPGNTPLAWQQTVTRRFVLQKARHHAVLTTTRSGSVSAHGFRICFTPRYGVLFTFPSRYWCTIGRMQYLALEGGPPCFPRDFACPAVLPDPNPGHSVFAYGTLTRSGRPFQQRSANRLVSYLVVGTAVPPVGPSNPTSASPAGCASSRV